MTQKTKKPAQLNRMTLRNQIDFFGNLFVEFSAEQKLMTSSANEIFGTNMQIPELDHLATNFRIWALTLYPTFAERIDSALYDASVHYFDGKDQPAKHRRARHVSPQKHRRNVKDGCKHSQRSLCAIA